MARIFPLVLPALFVACSGGIPRGAPFIRGTVAGGDSTRVLVEAVPRGPTGVEGCEQAAYVYLTRATRVRWRDGRRAARADLAAGRVVSVWITGLTQDSCPVQVEATAVVIEPAGTPAGTGAPAG